MEGRMLRVQLTAATSTMRLSLVLCLLPLALFFSVDAARRPAFVPAPRHVVLSSSSSAILAEFRVSEDSPWSALLHVRGGADDSDDDDEYDSDEYDSDSDEESVAAAAPDDESEYDEESEDEEEEKLYDAALAAAALKSTTKAKETAAAKNVAASKRAVNAKLKAAAATKAAAAKTAAAKPPAKPKKSLAKVLRIPYIVRATTNPWTLVAMTKAFWGSLFHLKYVQNRTTTAASGQELRSALEEKAKRSPVTPPKRGQRKMKRGQAKTLSDLPQLSS